MLCCNDNVGFHILSFSFTSLDTPLKFVSQEDTFKLSHCWNVWFSKSHNSICNFLKFYILYVLTIFIAKITDKCVTRLLISFVFNADSQNTNIFRLLR